MCDSDEEIQWKTIKVDETPSLVTFVRLLLLVTSVSLLVVLMAA